MAKVDDLLEKRAKQVVLAIVARLAHRSPPTANLAVEGITDHPNRESQTARKPTRIPGFLAKSITCSGQIIAIDQTSEFFTDDYLFSCARRRRSIITAICSCSSAIFSKPFARRRAARARCHFGRSVYLRGPSPRAAMPPPRRRAGLRIFVVRCGLPCDPPVGGHSCNGGMIPRFHRAVWDYGR